MCRKTAGPELSTEAAWSLPDPLRERLMGPEERDDVPRCCCTMSGGRALDERKGVGGKLRTGSAAEEMPEGEEEGLPCSAAPIRGPAVAGLAPLAAEEVGLLLVAASPGSRAKRSSEDSLSRRRASTPRL